MGTTFLLTLVAVLAIAVVFVIVRFTQFAHAVAGKLFQALMWLITAAGIAAIVLSGRVLRFGETGLQVEGAVGMGSTLAAKGLLALTIGFSAALCVAYLVKRWWPAQPSDRSVGRGFLPPVDITLAFLVFYLAFSVVPLAFTPTHQFHISLIYPLFIWWALLLWMRFASVDPVIAVKQSLAVLVLGSLLAAVVAPSLALQPGYTGLVPGFNQRLWGITANANSLGAVAMALFMIEACAPARRRWLHWVLLTAAAAVLVLSQSKAALGTSLVCAGLLWGWRWTRSLKQSSAGRGGQGDLVAAASVVVLAAIGVAVVWVALAADLGAMAGLTRQLDARALADISTGTGRIDIWQFALRSGLESPIFGHGLSLWSVETRLRTGLSGASHAHNQFLQVFTRSGVVGLLAFLWLLYLMAAYALRAAGPTRGGSVALLAAFLIRAMVEVPLQPNSVLGGEFFAFMVLLVYLIDRGGKAQSGVARFTGQPLAAMAQGR